MTTLGALPPLNPEPQGSKSTGVLASFWYYRRADLTLLPHDVPLILDSGAYSAFTSGGQVKLDEYAQWLEAIPRPYDFAFNLDVIGDSEASYRQWQQLREAGHTTVPVVHYGDRTPVLDRYLREGAQRVALSGAAIPTLASKVEKWQAYMWRHIRDTEVNVPVHGLGVHMINRLAKFPWDSTDSSAFSMAWRFGRATLWTGRKWVRVDLDGHQMYRYGAVCRRYGFEPEQVATSNASTRPDLVRLLTASEAAAAVEANLPRPNHRSGVRYLADTSLKDSLPSARALALRYVVDSNMTNLTCAAQSRSS